MDNILLLGFFILALSCANGSEAIEELSVYELKIGDFPVKISNWGANVVSFVVPDRDGKLGDVVLGYGSLQEYKNDTTYFGAIVGRVVNRIGRAAFTLDEAKYKLVANEGHNMLHGGLKGYSYVMWTVKRFVKGSHITLRYESFDGEQGWFRLYIKNPEGSLLFSRMYHKLDDGFILQQNILLRPSPIYINN